MEVRMVDLIVRLCSAMASQGSEKATFGTSSVPKRPVRPSLA